MTKKFKPCPFCGAVDAMEIGDCKELEECDNWEECPASPYVCVVCSINRGGCGSSTGYFLYEAKAVEVWNRRAEGVTRQ